MVVLFSTRSIRIFPSLIFCPSPNKSLLPIALIKVYFTFSSAIRDLLYIQIQTGEFENKTIGDLLSYEQPVKYIVVDTEYSDDRNLIPVLTANKTFILGYTTEQENVFDKNECIIFDDFTMDVKYVNFPFKVKSSAIKILTAKTNINLYFVYEYLLFLRLMSEEHKRHYISEIEPLNIAIPNPAMQYKIVDCLRCINEQIDNAQRYQITYQKQKQYLLNQIFI
ncbi:restriction endonuclease subunit S [Alistipes sp. NSJ-20]|uniref:Restriction endonuclease subunit S n=1 Tax=Alistipes hominis TaxID=2763015 RepID=A0ABR7CPJ4_9BACT|nr:restriction endonuclease subunit S [Alistipes hominis]MBC5617578.1 restriction endonuclease subunit S [Alistipes hominis]